MDSFQRQGSVTGISLFWVYHDLQFWAFLNLTSLWPPYHDTSRSEYNDSHSKEAKLFTNCSGLRFAKVNVSCRVLAELISCVELMAKEFTESATCLNYDYAESELQL